MQEVGGAVCERDGPGGDRECNLGPLIVKIPPPFSFGTFHLLGVHHSIRFEMLDHGGHGIRENHEKHLPPLSITLEVRGTSQGLKCPHQA